MVGTDKVWIWPSRLITGTPKYIAVAAIMRSAISGTSSRKTRPTAKATSRVRSAAQHHVTHPQRFRDGSGHPPVAALLAQVDDFDERNGQHQNAQSISG